MSISSIAKPTNLRYDKEKYKPGETNILYDDLQKGEQNLYIVSTPMQLISAIEAQNHFKTQNNVLVILFFVIGDGKNINDMFKLLEYFPYSKLITFQNSNKKNFFAFTKYLKEITQSSYGYVFFGYTSILYRRMIANLTYNKLFLLDNGIQTIITHKMFSCDEHSSTGYCSKSLLNKPMKHRLLHLAYASRGYKLDCTLEDLNFFTVFNLKHIKNKDIIIHTFSYVKKRFSQDSTIYKLILFLIDDKCRTGHTDLLAKNTKSIEKQKYATIITGENLYIYPSGIESKTNYQKEITNFLASQEKVFIYDEFTIDAEKIKKLQLSLVFFDELNFETIANEIISIFTDRLSLYSKNKDYTHIEDFINILNSCNQLMRVLFYGTNYFILHKQYFIKINGFYELFDLIIHYNTLIQDRISKQERKTILNHMAWTFSHYAKRASYFGESEKINAYLYEHHKNFKTRLLDILLNSSSYCYHVYGCRYESMLLDIYSQYTRQRKYEINAYLFFRTLKMANFLGKNINFLCEIYLSEKIQTKKIDIQISILQILLESPKYFSSIKDQLWLIYGNSALDKTHRNRAGLILVEAFRKIGSIQQARKLYFQTYDTFGCNSRIEAIRYLGHLEPLGLLYSHKNLFEELYYQFIAQPFMKNMNVDTTKDFLLYQFTLSKLDKLKDLNLIYQKILKPKVTKLIQKNDFREIIYINPFNEINNYIFPIHLYSKLLDEKFLIVNIEAGNIDFFNEYHTKDFQQLGNTNDAIIGSDIHWNSYYNEWEEDFKNCNISCDGLNIFQGTFEQISRIQKRFSVDFDSIATKLQFKMFKRRSDRNIFLINNIFQSNTLPIKFLSITSHYTPWSTYRDKTFQKNEPLKYSFIHVSPTYENYIHKMNNPTLTTITALNLTKYRKSRIAGFGASELFSQYAKQEYENTILPTEISSNVAPDNDAEYMKKIIQAKNAGKTIICLLGKIVYDLAVPNMNGTFSDMKGWVQETIDFITDRDDIFVLVKPHPHEMNYSISQYPNESFLDFVHKKSSDIYLMGHYEAGLDLLINHVDAFVLWNGTSTIELANARQNIIVCDDWAKRDYPIDLYQPSSKNEYFKALLDAKKWDKNSELSFRRQKLAFLYVEYMKKGDFFVRNPGVIRSSTNVDWNNSYFDMDKLFSEFANPTQKWDKILGNLI